ncbi:MAG TPA: phosphoribosylformylglycinamidine synthase I [Candidatus Omnitrophota bacterium]|nr:phosphoribosylformylglycinamidine synthase I [Candidatus Omnitrophota bacterium]HQJ16068.1 phosphoribosylformylglycinamidine synthase I [Candidatus Omnitrophota bacterium]
MKNPRVCVLRTAGTNCDAETAFAFEQAGAAAELVHINRFIQRLKTLDEYHILALPGGFSYGDDISAGKVLANELKYKLAQQLRKFIDDGKLVIGICNGFQVLVKAGLLPGNASQAQEASLIINDCGCFRDEWVYLRPGCPGGASKCVWTKDLPAVITLPIAHGEGKFVTADEAVMKRLKKNKQIVFQYCDGSGALAGYPHNPNGSQENIAGICDETGRILGLMPHPERNILETQHPRMYAAALRKADGRQIFTNGVVYAARHI